jgi:hypothetical protein
MDLSCKNLGSRGKTMLLADYFRFLKLFVTLASPFFLSTHLHAESNLVEQAGGPIVLLSSERVAGHKDNLDVEQESRKEALRLCAVVNKTLLSFETVKFEGKELQNLFEQKIYQAYIISNSQGGAVFSKGIFPLVLFPQNKDRLEILELFLYGGAGVSVVGGGLPTMLLAIGFEGPANPQAALIFGCTTAALTALCAISGGITTIYRKYVQKKGGLPDNEESALSSMNLYALPVLASKIICQ